MTPSPECLWLACFIMMLSWHEALLQCGEWEYLAKDQQCAPCAECFRGEEPDRKCGFGKGYGVACRPCPANMFSDSYGTQPCLPHTQCYRLNRIQVSYGSATADGHCGNCRRGFYAPAGYFENTSECLPCSMAPKDTPGCKGVRNLRARSKRTIDSALSRESIVPLNGTLTSSEESHTDYAVLAIVPVFCMMGLLGILLCNLLKKKGYHCTSQKELDEEAAAGEKHANNLPFRADDANEDTIGVLVRLITEKKENAFALEELLKDYQSKQITAATKTTAKMSYFLPPLPHVCRHQHHLHTVQGPAPRSGPCCTRCSQKKWPEVLLSPEMAAAAAAAVLPSKPVRAGPKPGRPGEITILSVGRFRVARIPEQKTNPCEVKTVLEPGGDGSDSPCNSPTEQKTLLGAGTKTKWLKAADNKPEVVN
ncbi:tumor necrosis factor receptor superfamily member 19L isoform X2 [Microcaecilia unicolor]|uniref:Tumor necrosis factor receptor superfamily member 19L isoform X2 n=1 Tax=Microcaecilia unicolor TaxID=1415580 RepID=A0A6P7XYS0_9AMPH|nr:tumor necrosis factor receptor superfamily member 19L isoform X2 [Microcaecilia unicolor]